MSTLKEMSLNKADLTFNNPYKVEILENGNPVFYFRFMDSFGENGTMPISEYWKVTILDWPTYKSDMTDGKRVTICTNEGEVKQFVNAIMANKFIEKNGGKIVA